ncbi:hypothetical protein BEI59_32075 [Eisenbergiella tayi]|uniref:Hemolysin XhlA n=1 Tax=Eisenbergiella tayi TaxID=1432052 RepID=A0A1E3U7L8_9FIRM|nr:hypothetical protein [Eisenbergiella tayi]ODR42178.1 hypothetical protein BEI59_32075 [Eisenbergiella tayi]RJW34240.1 hypothetical protein DXC97_24505 [Lachnospiraceae bacterium TF09-5]
MTDEEIAVKLEGHEHEIGSLKHRMEEQEEQNKVIQDLVMSVQKLALTMEAMVKEQSMQGERLKKLEDEPAERWNSAKKTAFTTIISVVAGALATGLIFMIASQLIK